MHWIVLIAILFFPLAPFGRGEFYLIVTGAKQLTPREAHFIQGFQSMVKLPNRRVQAYADLTFQLGAGPRPAFILVIGPDPAEQVVRRVDDIPVILGLVENGYFQAFARKKNVTGVMLPSQSWSLNLRHIFLPAVQQLFPTIKKLGLLVSPDWQPLFSRSGLAVITQEITRTSEIKAAIKKLKEKEVEGVLMLSGSPVPEQLVRKICIDLLRANPPLPVIGDQVWHTRKGAAVSIPIHNLDPDPHEYGRQAGFLANHLRLGLEPEDPRVKSLEIPTHLEYFDSGGNRVGIYLDTLRLSWRTKVIQRLKSEQLMVNLQLSN